MAFQLGQESEGLEMGERCGEQTHIRLQEVPWNRQGDWEGADGGEGSKAGGRHWAVCNGSCSYRSKYRKQRNESVQRERDSSRAKDRE